MTERPRQKLPPPDKQKRATSASNIYFRPRFCPPRPSWSCFLVASFLDFPSIAVGSLLFLSFVKVCLARSVR
ncbi:hypothetical protein BDZ91DRAFT_733874 [Kalaharituber pfeilii]|nr:hypothetical protein BDZ91DRAFT_733874 [Kalaharituber pfeilii]